MEFSGNIHICCGIWWEFCFLLNFVGFLQSVEFNGDLGVFVEFSGGSVVFVCGIWWDFRETRKPPYIPPFMIEGERWGAPTNANACRFVYSDRYLDECVLRANTSYNTRFYVYTRIPYIIRSNTTQSNSCAYIPRSSTSTRCPCYDPLYSLYIVGRGHSVQGTYTSVSLALT